MHRRLPWLVRSLLVACVPVLGLFMAIGQPAGASTVHSSASVRAAALAALKHMMIGQHGTNHAVGHDLRTPALTQDKSTNWSGYADDNTSSNTYSKVTGKWVEPAVTCTSTEALAAFWVGIDGFNSGTVEQDGTLAFCDGGSASYYTWWEMYPTNTIQIVGSTVSPGDAIAASVVKTGTKYALKITDSTTPADSFTTTQTCAAATCVDSSAEWIAEAPSGSGGILPLPNFKTWKLTAATVKSGSTSGKISTFPDDEITMVNSSSQVKAQPGPLNSAGNSFTVTWKKSS
jgi:hypothetical protein